MACLQTMRVVRHAESVTAEPLAGSAHTHSLDDLDRFKRPLVFQDLTGREVTNGYSVAEVSQSLRTMNRPEDQKALLAAGGCWLTSKDVVNACAAWKKQHPSSQQWRSFEDWQVQALAV